MMPFVCNLVKVTTFQIRQKGGERGFFSPTDIVAGAESWRPLLLGEWQ